MDERAKVTRSTRLPFVQVATAIILDQSLSPQARHLYTVLATYADINSREAKLLRSTLARDITKSVDTLDRLVKELVKAGIVTVLHQSVNGLHTSSIYSLHDAELIQSRAVQNAEIAMAAPVRPPHPEDTDSDDLSGRMDAASRPQGCGDGGRMDAAGVAAPVRHIKRDLEQETFNERASDAEPATGPLPTKPKKPRRTRSEMNANRPDVEHLCQLMVELIVGNGSKRPKVTESWLTDMRLLLDNDKRDPAKAEYLMRWAAASSFWRSNAKCPAKFREQYDTIRLQALEQWEKAQARKKQHIDHAAPDPESVPAPKNDPFAAHRESGIPA